MISRRAINVLKVDVVFPECVTVIRGAPRCFKASRRRSQTCPRRSQARPRHSQVLPRAPEFSLALRGVLKLIAITPMVLLYQSSEIPVTPRAGQNALLGSDTLLKLTHLSLHSTSSQTLLEASSD